MIYSICHLNIKIWSEIFTHSLSFIIQILEDMVQNINNIFLTSSFVYYNIS